MLFSTISFQSCSILAKQISSSTPRPLIHIKIVASKYILFTTKSVLANNVKHLQSLISYDHVIYEVIWSIYSYDHFTYEYIWFINHDSYSTKSGEFMFELYQWRPCRGQVAVWPGTLFPNSRGNKAAANLRLKNMTSYQKLNTWNRRQKADQMPKANQLSNYDQQPKADM